MDETIYLEQDEEITSVIDKLKNIEANSIALVIPLGAVILQSVVNLKILKKEAEALGKEIALVTQDKIGRNLASQVGLSVYDGLSSPKPITQPVREEPEINETIELDFSPKPEPIPPGVHVSRYDNSENDNSHFARDRIKSIQPDSFKIKPKINQSTDAQVDFHPRINNQPHQDLGGKKPKLKLFIGIIIFVLIVVLFYLFYPRAIVTLAFNSQPYQKEITILVDNNINKVDNSRVAIPGELQEYIGELKETYNTTGSKNIGEKATGSVRLTNGTGENQTLSSGSELRSASGLLFLTTDSVTIPKATASVDLQGNVIKNSGSQTVNIVARESGENYNISPTSFTVINNSKLTAESSQASSGGSTKTISVVTQDDINNAKADLTTKLANNNVEAITKKVSTNKTILEAYDHEVQSFEANKKADDAADNFEATLKIKSRTISFIENDYRQVIVSALSKDLSQTQELVLSPTDEITNVSAKNDFSTGILTLVSNTKTNIVTKVDNNDLVKQLSGKKINVAQNQLESIQGIAEVRIKLRPTWWFKIPSKIEIKKVIK